MLMCGLFLKKNTFRQKIFCIFMCVIICNEILYSGCRLFLLYSQYYSFINYLNTNNNIILITIFLYLFIVMFFNRFKVFWIFLLLFILIFYSSYSKFIMFNNVIIYSLKINSNLLNGIMLIHPPILYTTYFLILCHFYNFNDNNTTKLMQYKQYTVNTQETVLLQSLMLLFSVLLGCWWAEQELYWGGWWSWDFVEILALSIYTYSLFYIHYTNTNRLQVFFVLLLLISFICVRYNIINSIHNFSLANIINQYLCYIKYFILSIVVYICRYIISIVSKKDTIKYIYYIPIIFCIIIFILIIYFLINYFGFGNVIICNKTYITLLKIACICITLMFVDSFYFGVFLIFLLVINTNWLFIYLLTTILYIFLINSNTICKNAIHWIHICLLFFLCFSILQYYVIYNDNVTDNYTIYENSIKINQITKCVYIYFNFDCLSFFKNVFTNIFIDIQSNTIIRPKDIFYKNVFYKNVFEYYNIYFEKFNYNEQIFISFIFYQIFLNFSLLSLLLFFVKVLKKKNIYI